MLMMLDLVHKMWAKAAHLVVVMLKYPGTTPRSNSISLLLLANESAKEITTWLLQLKLPLRSSFSNDELGLCTTEEKALRQLLTCLPLFGASGSAVLEPAVAGKSICKGSNTLITGGIGTKYQIKLL